MVSKATSKGGLARWAECYAHMDRRMPIDDWRAGLAERLREAVGCTFATVHTVETRMEHATWPNPYGPLMEDLRDRFLARIEAAGEGAAYAKQHHGPVYAPLQVTQSEALRHDFRQFLDAADLRSYCVAFFGTGNHPLDSLVILGDGASDDVLLERAGPGLLGLAVMAQHRPPPIAPPSSREGPRLTGREREIAHLLAEGLSNLNVSHRLAISEQTVAVHTRSIYRKLGVHNRVDLARSMREAPDDARPT